MAQPADLQDWLRLLLTPAVGRATARRLLAAFGSPGRVLDAPSSQIAAVAGPIVAAAIGQEPDDLASTITAVESWLGGGDDRHVLTLGDDAYPATLLESPDPPLLLYVRGGLSHLSAPSVAIVGSRHPTPQGSDHAREFARGLGRAGLAVVSGLAQGIDAAAHEGALEAGAPTIAVTGTGPDRIYPRRHRDLALRIAAQGAIVTEYRPGTAPLAENFPQRNRIIAGLSRGTLVVEAALKSGSLITARLANEAGREVFAIPGSVLAVQSRGCHALIRDGAKLVESVDDVLVELRPVTARPGPARSAPNDPPAEPPPPPGPGEEATDPLLDALGHDPVSLDQIQARTGLPAAELLARLLVFELDGRVARLPGGWYQRRASA